MRLVFAKNTQEIVDVHMLLSMSKLNGSSAALSQRQQTPQECLEMMEEIARRFPSAKINFKFLYTDALYLNKDEQAAKAATRSLLQMTRHQEGFKKIAGARDVEFLSWNQVILDHNQGRVESALMAMRNKYARDENFAALVRGDTLAAKRGDVPNSHDIDFILQELAVVEMVRRADTDAGKVIVAYPGPPLQSDMYLRDKAHPIGIAAQVGHQAFWADVSAPEDVALQAFPLPQREEKSALSRYMVAASVAVGVFGAAAAGVAALTYEAPEPHFKVTELQGGAIILNAEGRTVIFPERHNLMNQVVIKNGKEIPGTNRADLDVALQDERTIKYYLDPQP